MLSALNLIQPAKLDISIQLAISFNSNYPLFFDFTTLPSMSTSKSNANGPTRPRLSNRESTTSARATNSTAQNAPGTVIKRPVGRPPKYPKPLPTVESIVKQAKPPSSLKR